MKPPTPSPAYIARQPIVDRSMCVAGYELLFRNALGAASTGFGGQGSQATARVLANSVMVEGLSSLVGDVGAWVNLTEQFIVDGIPELLSPHEFVFEVVDSVEPKPEVLDGCRRLREAGYRVALDDVTTTERLRWFVDCFDIVKVDWLAVPPSQVAAIVAEARQAGAELVAEKLETGAALHEAMAAGFQLFEGYALGFPQNIERRDVRSFSSHTLRLLQLVNSPGFDYTEVEAVVRTDPALTFKLLAFANSSFAAQSERTHSLRHALVLFGERNLRHAALLVFLAQVPGAAPSFAVVEALVAGLFSEALARESGRPDLANVCMLCGTLSHLDRLLGRPLSEVLERLPVDHLVKEALLYGSGVIGCCVQLARAFQDGDWTKARTLEERLGPANGQLQPLYERAVVTADRLARGDIVARARSAA